MGHIRETGFKGGVKVVDTAEQARDFAHEVLGKHLVTKQSGENGLPVNCVYSV